MRINYRKGELEGYWALFAKIAGYFVYKVPPDDREDFLHDMLLEMVKVKAKYEVKEKPLTEASLMMVASYELKSYWDKRRHRLFGINCSNCKSKQRQECRTRFPSECPKGKFVSLVSLDKPVENKNGDKVAKLSELIAHPQAKDPTRSLDARLDARRILHRLPKRLVKIGYKIYAGFSLEKEEEEYLKHWRNLLSRCTRRDHLLLKKPQRDHQDERILKLLRKNPQGLTRSDLSPRLQTCVREVNWYLNQLIKKQQVIAVTRENTRGRPLSPLLLIAGAEIPEEKNVRAERDEHIRQAYFIDEWSIKQIAREFNHCRRTVRRAIRAAGTV